MTRKAVWKPLLLLTLVGLVTAAVLFGLAREVADERGRIEGMFPPDDWELIQVNKEKWAFSCRKGEQSGFLYLGEGMGYNGPVLVLAVTDMDGMIRSLHVLEHTETPSYIRKLYHSRFFEQFTGLFIDEATLYEKTHAVSGATLSSHAVIAGLREAYFLGENLPVERKEWPVPGLAEMVIVILFTGGIYFHYLKNNKWRTVTKWLLLLISLVMLGFVLNQPITLSRVASMLSGYFPDVTREPGVYLLLGGGVLLYVMTRRNVYCRFVCPFGSAQDLLCVVGKAKSFRPSWHKYWKWAQWGAAFILLLLALARRDPSLAQYEVFPALFQLTGTPVLFGALALVMMASLFVKRPWCHFVCPVDGVFSFVRLVRNTFKTMGKDF